MAGSSVYYYFTALEFCTLMVASGKEIWYGPELRMKQSISDQEELNRVIATLYMKGYLEWDKNSAVISEEAARMFRLIRKAENCIVTNMTDYPDRKKYAYPAEKKVAVLSARENGQFIRMTEMTAEEWMDSLEEEGFFPHPAVDLQDEMLSDNQKQESFASLEVRDVKTGELYQTLEVFDKGLFAELDVRRGTKRNTCFCIRNEYEKILDNCLKRGAL